MHILEAKYSSLNLFKGVISSVGLFLSIFYDFFFVFLLFLIDNSAFQSFTFCVYLRNLFNSVKPFLRYYGGKFVIDFLRLT